MDSAMEKELERLKPWGASDIPEGAVRVDTYKKYREMVSLWATGVLDDTLVIIGAAGIGKSETALGELVGVDRYCYVKGRATKKGVYRALYEHIDEPVVLDDVDELLSDASVTGILKMLLETRTPRIMQWKTDETMRGESDLPPEFATKSRTMILANELKQVSRNFAAVLDRSTVIWFAPSVEEVIKYVATWFPLSKYQEVYDYISERLPFAPSPSCRYYYRASKWYDAGLDWRANIDQSLKPSDVKNQLIVELLANKKLKTDKARLEVWKEKTGTSEQAYYAYKKAAQKRTGKVSKRGQSISEAMKRKHAERKRKANGGK